MFFDIALVVTGFLVFLFFWREISNHNKLIDNLNVRLLHLERQRAVEKDRLDERCQLQTEHNKKHLAKYNR